MSNSAGTEETAGQSTTKMLKDKKNEHFIIAIGASAGGLEVIHDFFDNMTESDNLSFVIIQHLSPDYKSLLVELVSKHTDMQVFEATDGIKVDRRCIYVIPPRKTMKISDGHLRLTDKETTDKGPNTAIDIFLHSLAQDKKEKAIAVILSGTGTDGTRGIETIKDCGGLVIVQDPDSARFDGMPRSAIASGLVDMILTPEQIPGEIINYIHDDIPSGIFKDNKVDEEILEEIFKLIFKKTGCDFHHYKLPTLLRRITKRMLHLNLKKIEEYISVLQNDQEECKILGNDFLINVTRFFRDKDAFEALEREVFPGIVSSKTEDDVIKIWISACSTGEEAYSVAMLLDRYLKKVDKLIPVKIFATDIDSGAIETAARGQYPVSIENDIAPDILDAYFIKGSGRYHIIPEIRKQIVFARHNIIKDPPFIKNDLATCRNMLIYMTPALQKRVLNVLHFSLAKGGYLFLGSSETIAGVKESMTEVDRKWKIYRKSEHTSSRMFNYERSQDYQPLSRTMKPDIDGANTSKQLTKGLVDDFKDILSEDSGFAALYIDKNYEVKEVAGDFRKYLSLPDRFMNMNLLKMVSASLGAVLNSSLRKAWKDNKKVIANNVVLNDGGTTRSLNIIVKPGNSVSYTTIVIGETGNAPTVKAEIDLSSIDGEQHQYISDLKAELSETKHHLQTVIEELETTNEELQSSNEELLSSNEELQSSNEELQSLNEELHTLNTEHQLKISELIELNDDLDNYFRSTDIGQIFLDSRLHIRKFNPAAVKLINLIETDIGRPFAHISSNIRYDNIQNEIQNVVKNKAVIEKEVILYNGKTSLMRIYPYIRQDKHIDGVVLTFVDISAVKDLNNIINGVFNASQNAIMALKAVRNNDGQVIDFKWIAVNDSTEKIYNRKIDEIIGRKLKELYPDVVDKGLYGKYLEVLHTGKPLHMEYPYKCEEREGWWDVTAVKMIDGLAVTFTDITEKKEAEERIRANYLELINTKEKLKKLNEELEDSVAERTHRLASSEERFRLVTKATNDAIWDWDLVNNTIWWGESFFNMFGYDKEEITNVNYWLEKVHPEDQARVKQSIYKEINNNEKQWSSEYQFRKADGSYALLLDRGYILHNENDIPYRMLGSMMDITSLRAAQAEVISNIEQREFLAESMPLIVWTAEAHGSVTFLNQSFTAYTGIPVDKALQFGWLKCVADDSIEELKEALKNAIKSKNDFSLELKLKRQDGNYRWFLLRARAKKDADGKILMWVGTNTDIHEQKLTNEILEQRVRERTLELQHTNEELENSNHDLQQFASVASHDLKEPLRKIHMFSTILRDKHLAELDGSATYLERIISSSARMTKLINDLLSFSRLSAVNLFEPVNLNSVINEILADLELFIEEKEASVNIVQKIPIIEAIPGQMRQLFQNIISNALKFTRPGLKPEVNITSALIAKKSFESVESADGKFCRISISDNGIGFDEQYLNKIFTIFQRLHTKQEYEGTGIGLAICKKIVEKHSGLLTASSKEDEGATFTFILPLKQIKD
ncbi:MAG: PAS domain S-box protein [Sphingobacteriales bacterium]|nr:MAG: PAS domain S-box protein [Sphingobacteriales bacterium]